MEKAKGDVEFGAGESELVPDKDSSSRLSDILEYLADRV
jgi:hypothetical protein